MRERESESEMTVARDLKRVSTHAAKVIKASFNLDPFVGRGKSKINPTSKKSINPKIQSSQNKTKETKDEAEECGKELNIKIVRHCNCWLISLGPRGLRHHYNPLI